MILVLIEPMLNLLDVLLHDCMCQTRHSRKAMAEYIFTGIMWVKDQALEQAAQGGGGVTVPGGVQKTCRCGTLGSGSVGMVVLG